IALTPFFLTTDPERDFCLSVIFVFAILRKNPIRIEIFNQNFINYFPSNYPFPKPPPCRNDEELLEKYCRMHLVSDKFHWIGHLSVVFPIRNAPIMLLLRAESVLSTYQTLPD